MNSYLREVFLNYQNAPVDLQRIDPRLNHSADPGALNEPQALLTQTAAVKMQYAQTPYYEQRFLQQPPVGRTIIRQIQ